MILTAAADGALLLDGAPVVQDRLEATIRELFLQRDDRTIFLEADRSLPYAKVVDLMDACRAAGVSRIGVLTRKSAGEAGALN
jgi:biopolymer transport protein ExbD